MVFGGVWMVIFWAIVIGLVVWGVGRISRGKAERPDAGETPKEIAMKRLARGEITKEAFDELMTALR
jgi:uncharacterized membrane protein